MKALIFQEKVIQVQETEFEVAKELFWVDCPDDCVPGWTYIKGVLAPPVITPPDIPTILNEYNSGIQAYLNDVALKKGYESALYCLSYLNSSIPAWSEEANVFLKWRDTVWVYVLGELPKFLNGDRPLIPLEQFIGEFPVITWPS